MANTVKTIFTADASNLFRVADQAKAKIQSVSQFSNTPGSVSGGDLRKQLLDLRSIETSKQASLKTELAQLRIEKERLSIADKLKTTEARDLRQQERTDKLAKAQAIKEEVAAEKTRAAEVTAIHRQTAQNAKEQQRIITFATRERIANELKEERRKDAILRAGGSLTGEQRYARINLARQGADVFTQLGSGQGIGITAIQQGPQIVEAMAFSGIKLSGAMIASAAAIGTVAAVGALVVRQSGIIREEAERQLRFEEQKQGAINRQIILQKTLTAEFQKQRQLAEQGRNLTQFLGSASVGDLETRRANLERLLTLGGSKGAAEYDIDPVTRKQRFRQFGESDETKRIKQELQDVDAQLATSRQKNEAADIQSFEARWEAYKRSQADAARAEREATAQRFRENIEQAREATNALEGRSSLTQLLREVANSESLAVDTRRELTRDINEGLKTFASRIEDIRKNYRSVLTDLSQSASRGNDYAEQMFRAAENTQRVKEQLKDVPVILRSAVEQQLSLVNGLDAYSVRLQSRFNIAEQNTLLSKFTEPTQLQRQNALNRQIIEFNRVSNSTNPDVFYNFATRQRAIDQFDRINLQRELDEKLAATRGRLTEGERRITDRELVDLAQRVSPDDVRVDQRQEIAEAIKRDLEARRNADIEAVRINARLATAIETLNKNLANGTKVDLTVHDPSGATSRVSSPTPQSVNLSVVGGPGGLTSY